MIVMWAMAYERAGGTPQPPYEGGAGWYGRERTRREQVGVGEGEGRTSRFTVGAH